MRAKGMQAQELHLEVVLVDLLGQISHIYLAIECKGGGTLHQPLYLRPAEIFGQLCRRMHTMLDGTIACRPAGCNDQSKPQSACG